MINHTHAGVRCHMVRPIRTVKGDVPRGSGGTVIHEMDNLGRRLVLVHWDHGVTVPMFPEEIMIEQQSDGRPQ